VGQRTWGPKGQDLMRDFLTSYFMRAFTLVLLCLFAFPSTSISHRLGDIGT